MGVYRNVYLYYSHRYHSLIILMALFTASQVIMGNCCGVTPVLNEEAPSYNPGSQNLEEASSQSNAVTNPHYMAESSGYVSSHISGHMTPDSPTEPEPEPKQLEHIADREGVFYILSKETTSLLRPLSTIPTMLTLLTSLKRPPLYWDHSVLSLQCSHYWPP